jgi:hypothetical protein
MPPQQALAAKFLGLGDLTGGDFESEAIGDCANGSIVVGRSRSTSGWEAFRWTGTEGMAALEDLPGGLQDSYARDSSADGINPSGNRESWLMGPATIYGQPPRAARFGRRCVSRSEAGVSSNRGFEGTPQ